MLACLSLAPLEAMPPSERRTLFRRIATAPRRELLAERIGRPVPAAAVRAVGRADGHTFEREDWRMLVEVVARAGDRALAHVGRFTGALVRQYDAIPAPLRVPGFLSATSLAEMSAARWRQLDDILARLPEPSRASLRRKAREVEGRAGLWDFFFLCRHELEESLPFPVEHPRLGSLRPLATAEAMRREGRQMQNCMARCIRDVLDGQAVYYRWIGAEPANVELLRRGGGRWALGTMAGQGNVPLSASTKNAIVRMVRRELGDERIDAGAAANVDPPGAPGIARAGAVGRAEFTAREVERIAEALRRIRGRSVSSGNGAFCTVTMPDEFYVQFLARTDRPWLRTEISSHRWRPNVADRLNEETVSFLESCHFPWPLEEANFAGSLPASTEADCARAAAFALGALRIVFGHSSGSPLVIETHVPPSDRSGAGSPSIAA